MVLGNHQLQIGILSGLLGIVSHIDHDFFLGCSHHSQRLPCVQAAKAPAHVLRADAVMNLYGGVQSCILQNRFRCLQLALQQLSVGMVLTADLIYGIDTDAQRVYISLCHLRTKGRMEVIRVQVHDILCQCIIIVEIDIRHRKAPLCRITGQTELYLLDIDRLRQFHHIVDPACIVPL